MKTFTINRSSWHHALYHLGTHSHPEDFCQYTRGVMVGMFWALVIAALGGGLAMAAGDFLAWAVVCLSNWTWLDPNLGAAVINAVLAFTVMFFGVGFIIVSLNRLRQRTAEQEPGFIRTAYGSMKNRFCIRVVVE